MRKITLWLLTALSLIVPAAAVAQTCAPVAALPDAERRIAYAPSSSTGPFSVTFALLGDSTDYGAWLEVWLNGIMLNPVTDWQLTIPAGTLATACRPITNASVTLTTAATGTLQIVGARRPRRTSQFAENRGVAARDINQVITDIVATERETWDKINDVTGRAVIGVPGEDISPLPSVATRAGKFFIWDGSGNPSVASPTPGLGNVVGPPSSVIGQLAAWNNTTGTLLKSIPGAVYADAFGCVADGSTLNDTCVANAVASLPSTGGTIYFNPSANCYAFGSTIAVQKNGIEFRAYSAGGGTDNTALGGVSFCYTGSAAPLIRVGNASDNVVGFALRNITLDGRCLATFNLEFTDVQRITVENVFMRDATVASLTFDNHLAPANPTGWGRVDGLIISQKNASCQNGRGVWLNGSGATGVSQIVFTNPEVTFINGDAYRIDQGDGLVFIKPFAFVNGGGTGHGYNLSANANASCACNSTFIHPETNKDFFAPVFFSPTTTVSLIDMPIDTGIIPTGTGAASISVRYTNGAESTMASASDIIKKINVSGDFTPQLWFTRQLGSTFTNREWYFRLNSLGGVSAVDNTAGGIERFLVETNGIVDIGSGGVAGFLRIYSATGNALFTAPAGATPSIQIPTVGGTIPTTASAPLSLNTTTGQISCATCGGLTVGTSTITSGTTTRVLFDNAGVLGEYTITGSGNVVMSTSPTLVTPVLGTPTSVTLTNGTGLPISTGVSGLGTNVATFLGTPTSANLAAALTDETGTGAAVFGTSPTFTTQITTPKIIGGAGTTGAQLTLQTTTGAGTTDAYSFTGGNNGASTFATLNSTGLGVGGAPSVRLHGINSTGGDMARIQNTGVAASTNYVVSDGSGSDVKFGSDGGGNLLFIGATGKGATFFTNNAQALNIDGGSTAHHYDFRGTAPGIASCGTGSPTVTGNDMGGEITMGTGTPASCTINFAATWSAAPKCTVSWQSNLAAMAYTISTTQLVLTQTATSSNKVNYHCAIYSN